MMTNKKTLAIVFGVAVLLPFAQPAEAASNDGASAGSQLQQTREMLERARLEQQIEEDRSRSAQRLKDERERQGAMDAAELSFDLKGVQTSPSRVFTDAMLDEITAPYLNRKVKIRELYEIVDKLNDVYAQKGFVTCRAFLGEQTLKDGVVYIKLIEGTTGNITINGNKTTRSSYILNRLHLPGGEIPDVGRLNEDIVRFNGTNDVQLRIALQAGEKAGTTDFVITAAEPARFNTTLFTDNSGNYSSGEVRGGVFLTGRSLSGERDNLTLGYIRSEGTDAFSANYSRHVGRSGSSLNLSFNTNSVTAVRPPNDGFGVKGHASSYTVGYIQPCLVNDKTRSEAGLEYTYQDSKTSVVGTTYNHDQISEGVVSYAHTDYGRSHVFYQKHSGSFGGVRSLTGAFDKHYSLYRLNTLWQKAFKNGDTVTARFQAQVSGNNYLPSARMFYIGGANSVRGYKETFLGGDSGYFVNLEYQYPVYRRGAVNLALFAFWDYGDVRGDSAYGDHIIAGTGAGIKCTIANRTYMSLTLGFPLRREINEELTGRTRVHFLVSHQF